MKKIKKLFCTFFLLVCVILSCCGTLTACNNDKTGDNGNDTDTSQDTNELTCQEGVTLHCWNWSYNTIRENLVYIKQAGYTSIQTSPVQQPKDYNSSWKDWSGQWWKLYQPVSLSIATNSWIGTATELSALCASADDYGIKVIVDIVANHLGNNGSDNYAPSTQIQTYEPTIYSSQNTYFHTLRQSTDNSSIQKVVQGNIGMPDLNTGNQEIQDKVLNLLKSCIDCGVDGFRFDAAKHIETHDDGTYASNFWPYVINGATEYAKTQKNIDLYCYGEVLGSAGTGRSFNSYATYMSVTADTSGNNVRKAICSGNASGASSNWYNTELLANKNVLWAESHDTYANDSKESTDVSEENINKTWAIVASRADAMSLYFARPTSSSKMCQVGSTAWKNDEVAQVNKFHNYYNGKYEYLSNSGSFAMNERYLTDNDANAGCVIISTSSATSVSMPVYKMANGTYIDQISGNTFTVSNGKITGTLSTIGIAVIYNLTEN